MPGLTLVVSKAAAEPTPGAAPTAQAALDFITEGARIRPRLAGGEAHALLSELAHATAELALGQRARASVRVSAEREPWELAIERAGCDALVTLFQGGGIPEVALHERRVSGADLRAKLLAAIDAAGATSLQDGSDARLACAREALQTAPWSARERADGREDVGESATVAIEPTGELPIVIGAEIQLRVPRPCPSAPVVVHRADLPSLLFRGKIRLTAGGASRELPDVFVFLVAEQLVTVCLDAFEAWSRGRPSYRRLTVGGAICGVRLGSDGAASLTLGVPRQQGAPRSQPWTFPAVDVSTLVQGVVAFARALTRSLIRRDRAQASNLRLLAFRAKTRELAERHRDANRNDSKVNDAPESYRAFAASSRPSPASSSDFGSTRLRFTPRWFAQVPSIDLRSTFLCGDRLLIGQARDLSCIDKKSGEILWQRPAPRAVSVMTPLGLARLEAEGALSLHEIERGDAAWSMRLTPRAGGGASGAVVSAPGLPRLLLVSEGARHLVAIDLYAGDIRWRFSSRRAKSFKIRRAGKLAIIASGEPALSALDLNTGEVVWRFCDRLRFTAQVAVDHDALFAVAGEGALVGRGGTRLHHLDPWSGVVRWNVDLPMHATPVGAPMLADDTVVVATSSRSGTGLFGFDRKTGALLFDRLVCTSAASCMMIDGAVIVNSEGGELVAISASDGSPRYRHVFSGGAEGDRPRRLEPVLRSGALFVPQSEVHVVRPSDGTLLGRVPGDIIPDLLRVDERCDVYVVEESGHIAAYSAAPRLSLVK